MTELLVTSTAEITFMMSTDLNRPFIFLKKYELHYNN